MTDLIPIRRELLERIDESAICDGTDATISDDLFTQLVGALDAPLQPAEVGELAEALRAADEYLSSNRFNEIGSGSILHRQMQAALAMLEGK